MKDLTKGKPSRLILAFAIPIFMANILQLTYSIVDTRIVGSYLGETHWQQSEPPRHSAI